VREVAHENEHDQEPDDRSRVNVYLPLWMQHIPTKAVKRGWITALVVCGVIGAVAVVSQRSDSKISQELNDSNQFNLAKQSREHIIVPDVSESENRPEEPDFRALENLWGNLGVSITGQLKYVADVKELPVSDTDVPFLWHVPFGGGRVAMAYMEACLKLMQTGAEEPYFEGLEKVEVATGNYINANTFTLEGIKAAEKDGLLSSDVPVDVINSPLLFQVTRTLFKKHRRGRIFALFVDPIEFLVARFYEENGNDSSTSIEEYAKSGNNGDAPEFNWMTKLLSNYVADDIFLTDHHLNTAMEVIRRKFIVGLADEMEVSMRRFEAIFGWDQASEGGHFEIRSGESIACGQWPIYQPQQLVLEGSEVHTLLRKKNMFDVRLFEYIKYRFTHAQD